MLLKTSAVAREIYLMLPCYEEMLRAFHAAAWVYYRLLIHGCTGRYSQTI